ncbi:MAG: ComEC/Rec2 family competence protein [Christensenellales bacterium]
MTKSQKNKNKITSKEKSQGKDNKSKKQFSIVRLVVFLTICIITVGVCLGFKTQIENLLNHNTNLSANDIDKNGLTTHFVDVGQGDGIAIRFPDGKTMLVDAGPKKNADNLITYLKNNFFDSGENTFDYLLLTHSDEDHCGGMAKVCEEFTIKKIFRPYIYSVYSKNGINFDETSGNATGKTVCNSQVYYNTITAFNNETTDVIFTDISVLNSTEKIQGENYSIDFYYPTKNYITTSDVGNVGTIVNNYSPIMVLNYNDKKVMLTGDISTTGEDLALNNSTLPDIDVLKVAHHGSGTSSGSQFLSVTKPEYAIISCGKDNSYGHPTAQALNRLTAVGSEIYRTDLNGNVVVNITTGTAKINIVLDQTSNEVYICAEYVMFGIILVSVYFCFGIKIKQKH